MPRRGPSPVDVVVEAAAPAPGSASATVPAFLSQVGETVNVAE